MSNVKYHGIKRSRCTLYISAVSLTYVIIVIQSDKEIIRNNLYECKHCLNEFCNKFRTECAIVISALLILFGAKFKLI